MKNLNATDIKQEVLTATTKKVWAKPVLDILKLESAQHGTKGIPDTIHKHSSY